VTGIWRRIRSLFGERPASEPAPLPKLPYIETDPPVSQPSSPPLAERESVSPEVTEADRDLTPRPVSAPVGPPSEPPRSGEVPPRTVEQIAESISTRLVEDERLRGNLTDDEFQPLLNWALERVGQLRESHARLAPAAAEARLQRAGDQIFNLLRIADLAVGQRATATPDLVVSRIQMLDTLLAPPLFEEEAANRARARLDALLTQPAQRLQAASGTDIARRLAEALS
jgi:hypothetical protein